MSFGWGFGGGGLGMPRLPDKFEEQYHCYSVAYADKSNLEGGDKILLPPSSFDTLARLNIEYPMLFQLQSHEKGTMTHCGVMEFTAEEGSCFIPFWMMQNLLLEEGSLITVTNVSLPKATFVKLQPQSVDFLDIHNPRAVLEHALRSYSCVTKGDVICIPYNSKNYHFMLKEVKPQDAACIIETDCNVDFDAPVGYKEPDWKAMADKKSSDDAASAASSFANMPKQSAFGGTPRQSRCPSPTGSSVSGASASLSKNNAPQESNTKPPGIRIQDGVVIRPDDDVPMTPALPAMMAPKTGATGVQNNAAIPKQAPPVDYWAVAAGDGARLDGKAPTVLKDKEGKEMDIRALRAEAAARRAAALEAQKKFPTKPATTLDGRQAPPPPTLPESAAAAQRKSRLGNKYSKLKQGHGFAFEGKANKFT